MTEEFSHVLFGRDPGVAWSAEIKSADFVEGENIVFVASTYRVSMLYNFFATTGITLRQTYQVMPFFSRRFTWNDGKVADKYVY